MGGISDNGQPIVSARATDGEVATVRLLGWAFLARRYHFGVSIWNTAGKVYEVVAYFWAMRF